MDINRLEKAKSAELQQSVCADPNMKVKSIELSDRLRNIIKMMLIVEDDISNTLSNVTGNRPAVMTPDEPTCLLEAIEVIESRVSLLADLSRDLYNKLR